MKIILDQSVDRLIGSTFTGHASIDLCLLSKFTGRLSLWLAALAVGFLAPAAALASDPVGVYALVEKVVLEPSEKTPERIQVWGAFAIAEKSKSQYKKAEAGYLYYTLDPARSTQCQKEWADLKVVAGSGQIVSFGSRYSQNGKIRLKEAKPESPDVYPPGMGMVKVRDRDYGPINDLVKFRKAATKETAARTKSVK